MLLATTLLFAQSSSSDGGGGALAIVSSCCCFGFFLLIALIPIAGVWKVFVKAGEPGWAAIVPLYNMMTMAKIGGKDPSFGLMTLIPFYGIYVSIVILADVCKAFGKDTGFVIGMLLLPYVFWPILGFGSATYRPVPGSGGPRRMRDRDDDEDRPRRSRDDDYEDRPRRSRDDDDDDYDRPRRGR
jgi:hypothetical protein